MLKRIVKLGLSAAVAAYDGLTGLTARLLGRKPPGTAVVLVYHGVKPGERARFARHMDELVRRARPIRTDAAELPEDGGRHAAVTFDDGHENILENALPELIERNIPATLFIVTDILGGHPTWEHFGGEDPALAKAMTEDQLRQLPSTLFAIGSHTATHPVLTTVDDEALTRELAGSRARLEAMLDRKVTLFSFPYGVFDDRLIEKCREAGYSRVFTGLPLRAFAKSREFVTGRVLVDPTDWPIEFRLKLAGAYRWMPAASILKRKIFSVSRERGTHRPGLQAAEKGMA